MPLWNDVLSAEPVGASAPANPFKKKKAASDGVHDSYRTWKELRPPRTHPLHDSSYFLLQL